MSPQLPRKRQRSIRVLLATIFIIPLASLIGLWVFAASVTASNAIREHNFNKQDNEYGASAQDLLSQLATERVAAFEWLNSGRRGSDSSYLGAIHGTNQAVTSLQHGLYSGPAILSQARPALADLYKELAWLGGVRTAVEHGTISPLTSFNDYNRVVDAEFDLYSQLVVVNNTPLYMQAAASVEAGRSVELASREVTLVTGALMPGGQMTKPERILFAQTAATRQVLMTDAIQELDPALGSGYQAVQASSTYTNFAALETGITDSIGDKGPVPGVEAFSIAAASLLQAYQRAESQDRVALSSMATHIGNTLLWQVGLAGGLGLLAVVLSIFLMLRFGRRISRDLTGLQRAARDLAEERLPRVVAALSRGEDVDVAAEAAPIEQGRIAETARVAEAFSSVQRTAVEAAVGQARLRAGVAQVFRNLAWRSQSLLHRQLSLLDGMERRSSEPETLEELFQLDHLTTRMRRHAEGLIILSGATPGRGWREPVPIMDVLRGAIAEVEDYKRVTVLCESQDAIVGTAVADVIHMFAELIENATTYSPASTEVMIRAERVANGFAVEIEDRGIGIGADEMAGFNDRLANPPEFDIADSNQLGLFVVARLAAKHHIRITLRSSPFGGTSAVVLLPHQIVAMSDGSGGLGAGVRVVGNGRELISAGRELPASGGDHDGSGRELGSNGHDYGREFGGPGREFGGPGRELAAGGGLGAAELPSRGERHAGAPELPSRGERQAGGQDLPGRGERSPAGQDLIGIVQAGAVAAESDAGRAAYPSADSGQDSGGYPVANGWDTAGNGWELPGNGWEAAVGTGPQSAGSQPRPADANEAFDVFSLRSPAEPGNGAAGPAPAAGNGRLTPYAGSDDGSAWPGSPARETGAAAEPGKPWLPRRVRQASLAPQLRTDAPLVSEETPVNSAGPNDGNGAAGGGPSPADTRALVQSLQFGLELARNTDSPGDDAWPSPGEEPWPSPAGNPDLVGWPEDDGGQ
jgi:signal transduction histidine kinase